MKRRFFTAALALSLCVGLLPSAALAVEGDGLTPIQTSNYHDHSYGRYSTKPTDSYLVSTEEGYLRVENTDSGVVAERYDANFQFLSQQYLPKELSIWGGFFAGEDYYFAVYGEDNDYKDDSVETLRVVKYDKNLNRLAAAAYTANNTTRPFYFGSLRMAECDGMLYIRTCHEMYNGHQANMTLEVRESDMVITDEISKVSNVGSGYVSHSFNQFIAVSGDKTLVALDHGDAYPRSAVLMTYSQKAGAEKFLGGTKVASTDLLTFKGATGDNTTGAELGGLAVVGDCAIVAGLSIDQSATATDTTRNLFLATASVSNIEENNTLTWLTRYTEEDDVLLRNPHLTAAGDEAFLIWEETSMSNKLPNSAPDALHIQRLDAKGSPVGEAVVRSGTLSDCEPIYQNGKIIWYTTHASVPRFYVLDTETLALSQHIPGDPTMTGSIELNQDVPVVFGDNAQDYWYGHLYLDVKSTDWYADAVRTNIQAGFMQGTGADHFEPGGTVSVAQAVTMACRLHAAFWYKRTTINLNLPASDPWYQSVLDYADIFGITYPEDAPGRSCTREEFVSILLSAVPANAIPAIHEGDPFQGDLFQTEDSRAAALAFYRAGVINGVAQPDGSMSFHPQGTLSRSEAAAILARLIRTEQRV